MLAAQYILQVCGLLICRVSDLWNMLCLCIMRQLHCGTWEHSSCTPGLARAVSPNCASHTVMQQSCGSWSCWELYCCTGCAAAACQLKVWGGAAQKRLRHQQGAVIWWTEVLGGNMLSRISCSMRFLLQVACLPGRSMLAASAKGA